MIGFSIRRVSTLFCGCPQTFELMTPRPWLGLNIFHGHNAINGMIASFPNHECTARPEDCDTSLMDECSGALIFPGEMNSRRQFYRRKVGNTRVPLKVLELMLAYRKKWVVNDSANKKHSWLSIGLILDPPYQTWPRCESIGTTAHFSPMPRFLASFVVKHRDWRIHQPALVRASNTSRDRTWSVTLFVRFSQVDPTGMISSGRNGWVLSKLPTVSDKCIRYITVWMYRLR